MVLDTQGEIAKQLRIARTRLMMRCPTKEWRVHICHPRSDGLISQGSTQRGQSAGTKPRGSGGSDDGPQDRLGLPRERERGASCVRGSTERSGGARASGVADLKRMMFETNAFACGIIRGDSSLSGVEQFWKLNYNI